jgi:8-oxo-dGTP pyrophosphatase MutT (NUDIX family)
MPRAASRETSAGGIVVHRDKAGLRYLVIQDVYRNWGFPKGHLERGERPEAAARREVAEEAGVVDVEVHARLDPIDWRFRVDGRTVHKTCHFFLMETPSPDTTPQRSEGITACRWVTFEEAERLVTYDNARTVLRRAHALALSTTAERDRAVTAQRRVD